MMKKFFKDLERIIKEIDREPIGKLLNELEDLARRQGRLFILGVGGSAANASHAVNDFRKLCGIECFTPTDNAAELTARINDEGWVNCYADWLKTSRLAKEDLVLILSVGGGNEERGVSVNLIKAIKYAKGIGAKVAGIIGRDGGYTKKVADICVLIPTVNDYLITPFVESFQVIILHFLAFHSYLQVNFGKWESIALKK